MRERHRFEPRVRSERTKNLPYVVSDGFFAEMEGRRDLVCGRALAEQLEDLALAFREMDGARSGFLTALSTVSTLAGVMLLVLWAIAAATDYGTGLIRILVQAHPNRVTLLAGKIAALSIFTVLATTVTTLVVVVFARPLARLEGIEIDAWKTDFPAHLLEGFFNFTIAGLVWGLIGLMLAVVTRSAAMAIGIGIGFLLVVEGLITIFAPDVGPYLPGGTLSTLAAGGNDQLAWGAAFGLVVLYGVAAATVSLAVFRTRDIVS